jgi:hemerythrin-like domain-containing protein
MDLPDLESMPENLLRAPLDFLFADHFRQLLVCNFLDTLAAAERPKESARMAAAARDFLTRDLPLHIADEENELFARLRAKTTPGDRNAAILAILAEEHREDMRLAEPLLRGLDQIEGGRIPAAAFALAVAAFTAMQRRHVSWENHVLLPLARQLLSAPDLEAIGRGMAARRGVAYPG